MSGVGIERYCGFCDEALPPIGNCPCRAPMPIGRPLIDLARLQSVADRIRQNEVLAFSPVNPLGARDVERLLVEAVDHITALDKTVINLDWKCVRRGRELDAADATMKAMQAALEKIYALYDPTYGDTGAAALMSEIAKTTLANIGAKT